MSKLKIILCIFVANSDYDASEGFHILWIFSVVNPGADKVTEYSSEVFVAGIGDEASAVGEHSDKAGEHTEVGKATHLVFHSVTLVVKPPARAKLNLCGRGGGLKISYHCAKNVVILGIKGIKDSLRVLILLAIYFHTSTDYILELTDEPTPYPRHW